MKTKFKLSPEGEINYNATDAKGHERGDMGKGKPKVARCYSVFRIIDGLAHAESRDAWGGLHRETLRVETLEPWTPPPGRF